MLKKIFKDSVLVKSIHILLLNLLTLFFKPLKYFLNVLNNLGIIKLLVYYCLPSDKLILRYVENSKFIISTNDFVNSKKIYVNSSFPQYSEFCKAKNILNSLNYDLNSLVDVGSHYGNIVIPAVINHKLETAYAFEPINNNFEILNMNISINKLNSVIRPRKVFVSDHNKTTKIHTYSNNSAAALSADNLNSLSKKRYININNLKESTTESIKTVKLEDEFEYNDLGKPIFWLYAQGSEYNIINGSKSLFKHHPPTVIAYSPLLYKYNKLSSEKFYKLLYELNYKNVFDLNAGQDIPKKNDLSYLLGLDDNLHSSSSTRLLLFN